ncbi:MAG TPA: cytochrome c oxidase subunit II [Gammaproteobacteria bacterium]|nr:cytochrome c oxidase subunit II [Gammaproteobacteria bacterium]
MKKRFAGLLAGLVTLALTQPALAEFGLNMRQGVTDISHKVYDLHMLITYVCIGLAVLVFGAMFYSILNHRKSKGHEAATFHESTTLEIVWTIIPFIILIAMAIPAAKTLIAMEDNSDSDLTIKVTGYQWKWRYEYMDGDAQGVSYFSILSTPREQIENAAAKGEHYLLEVDEPLVVPVNKKVRFLVTSNDVLHSWWVPDFAVKQDAVPGFINEAWAVVKEPGTYRGQCAELCGKDHGFMPINVVAMNDSDFVKWASEKKSAAAAAAGAADKEWSKAELLAKGEAVYGKTCAACHQPNGKGIPGVFPAIEGSPVATGPVDQHIAVVMNGRPGTAMQAFAGQLNDLDIAAVVTYQRNAFGNNVGDVVQPKQIKAKR